jgi:hypothetical protein
LVLVPKILPSQSLWDVNDCIVSWLKMHKRGD